VQEPINSSEGSDNGNKADSRIQLAPIASDKGKSKISQPIDIPAPINKTGQVQRKEVTQSIDQDRIGIDSMLPVPTPLDNIVNIIHNAAEEAVGGMDGRVQEIHTNLQEGVPKGRGELTHVMHEEVADHSSDYRAPTTPISSHKNIGQQGDIDTSQQQTKSNNKLGGKLSNKRRDAIIIKTEC